jgi:hypothetical protein
LALRRFEEREVVDLFAIQSTQRIDEDRLAAEEAHFVQNEIFKREWGDELLATE